MTYKELCAEVISKAEKYLDKETSHLALEHSQFVSVANEYNMKKLLTLMQEMANHLENFVGYLDDINVYQTVNEWNSPIQYETVNGAPTLEQIEAYNKANKKNLIFDALANLTDPE